MPPLLSHRFYCQNTPAAILMAGAFLALLFPVGGAHAQFSAYVSGSGGTHSNPLYSYEQIGDQLRSMYLELAYSAGGFRGKYAGGLMVFNRLTDRNYLDHGVWCSFLFHPEPGTVEIDSLFGEVADDKRGEEDGSISPDSAGLSGDAGLNMTARHDKSPFREFDNFSAGLAGGVRWGFAQRWHLRARLEGGHRVYPFTQELSNASGMLTVEAGYGEERGVSTGVRSIAGIKYFTAAAFDSSRFESARTYVTVTKPGAGKGGAKIIVKEGSGKAILANPDVRMAGQLGGAGYLRFGWEGGAARLEFLYRQSVTPAARVLARTPESATINEDLYNDFFSTDGPEAALTASQMFPGSVHVLLTLQHERKLFGIPPYASDGTELDGKRIDRRTALELSISRYTSLAADVGFDITFSGGVMRNASNDSYNDFTGWSFLCSLGFGF